MILVLGQIKTDRVPIEIYLTATQEKIFHSIEAKLLPQSKLKEPISHLKTVKLATCRLWENKEYTKAR